MLVELTIHCWVAGGEPTPDGRQRTAMLFLRSTCTFIADWLGSLAVQNGWVAMPAQNDLHRSQHKLFTISCTHVASTDKRAYYGCAMLAWQS